jgi:predicted Co/Zn/Cd cation transporter (cation efflux family)
MSPEWVIGILVTVILGLVGIIYGLLRAEDKRLAKNIHSLRNLVQSVIMTLASRGIKVPRKDDDR